MVGSNDLMPKTLCISYFLYAQVYIFKESELFQDNQSTELLEKNGRWSSVNRIRRINILFL